MMDIVKSRTVHGMALAALVALWTPGCEGAEGGDGQGKGGKKGGRGPGVRVVTVEKVERRQLVRTGSYRGELRAEKIVEVAPDVQGRIKKLHVDMGSPSRRAICWWSWTPWR